MHPTSNFLDSSLVLGSNAYKSIIFRASAILVQFAIYKLFSFIAFVRSDFTAFLMFAEALPQQLYYAFPRSLHMRSGGVLVLSFIIFLGGAALYDTMLWALDSPGYVLQNTHFPASTLQGVLRPDPAYNILSRTTNGDLNELDLQRDLGEGLWETGTNASFTGAVDLGYPQVAGVANYSDYIYRGNPGARIWLDDEGFSVSIDNWRSSTRDGMHSCPETYAGINNVTWQCLYDSAEEDITSDFFDRPFAIPDVWWDAGDTMDSYQPTNERGINLWSELGSGGDTVLMKEVFTVTKGRRRHVFLISAVKVTLLSFRQVPLPYSEMSDLVQRMAPDDTADRRRILNAIRSTNQDEKGLTIGRQSADAFTVHSRVYQLLNYTVYSAFQILDSNITLVRSETLPSAPVPFENCDNWYVNEAMGGKVRRTNCVATISEPGKMSRFLGQIDVSMVFVLWDTLGSRRATTSDAALNGTAWSWMTDNIGYIDSLVLSRGYILGVSIDAVTVAIGSSKAAISILQLVLVLLPIVVAAVVYGVVLLKVALHYQSSLLGVLVAATHVGNKDKCKRPGWLRTPPEMGLVAIGEHVLLGTKTGVFHYEEQEMPYGIASGQDQGAGEYILVNRGTRSQE